MDMTYTCEDTMVGCAHDAVVTREWNSWDSVFPNAEITARLAWVDQSIESNNFTCDLNTDNENDITNCMVRELLFVVCFF